MKRGDRVFRFAEGGDGGVGVLNTDPFGHQGGAALGD